MTRINVLCPSELNNKMLVAEAHEITRVFGLARKAQFDIMRGKRKLPSEYTLGTGHVLFFYNKLKFIADRYESLVAEMRRRGYKPNPIPRNELLYKIDPKLHDDYIPTADAIRINRERIELRLQPKEKLKQDSQSSEPKETIYDRMAEETFEQYLQDIKGI